MASLSSGRIGTERFGIRIAYSYDGPRPAGTLGAIRQAVPRLGRRFLVLYGDTYLRIDYGAAAAAWKRSGLPAMMTVLLNKGRWDVSNASFDGERVTGYDKVHPTEAMCWIDYGLGGLDASVLDAAGAHASDLADLYRELVRRRSLFGFAANERFYEIGNPESLAETSAFLSRAGPCWNADVTCRWCQGIRRRYGDRVKQIRWFHTIDLGDGIITPGIEQATAWKLSYTGPFSEDLSGETVLDVGAWDGFFSFECERRGAKRVLATDSLMWRLETGRASSGRVRHRPPGAGLERRQPRD